MVLAALLLVAAGAVADTGGKKPEWLNIEVSVPEAVNQCGALVCYVELQNKTDELQALHGVLSMWLGDICVFVQKRGGDTIEIPGREALSCERNPFIVREMMPGGSIVIPVYILKYAGEFVFAECGQTSIRIVVHKYGVEIDKTIDVERRDVGKGYRSFFAEWVHVYMPYSCAVGDKHVEAIQHFTGEEREEIARFVEWMYGGSGTSLMINKQKGKVDYEKRFRELNNQSYENLDALSSDETYWTMYAGQGRSKNIKRLMYLH